MACKRCHADDCNNGSKCLAEGLNQLQMVGLAELVGASVSEDMLREMTARAPQLSTVMHALGLAWAARVAVEGLTQVFEDEKQVDALREFKRLLELTYDSADTRVAMKMLEMAGQEKARG